MGVLRQLWKFGGGGGIDLDVASRCSILGITDVRTKKALSNLIKTFKGFNATQSGFIDFTNPDPKTNVVGVLWLGKGDTDLKRRMNFMKPEDSDASFRLSIGGGSPETTPFGLFCDGVDDWWETHLSPYTHLTNRDVSIASYTINSPCYSYSGTSIFESFGLHIAPYYFQLTQPSTGNGSAYIYDGNGGGAISSGYDGADPRTMENILYGGRFGANIVAGRNGTLGVKGTRDISINVALDVTMSIGTTKTSVSTFESFKRLVNPYRSVGKYMNDTLQSDFNAAVKEYVDSINPAIVYCGASITAGQAASPLTNMWVNQLALNYGFPYFNTSLAGAMVMDGYLDNHFSLYGTRELLIPNKTRTHEYLVFSDFGFNDLHAGQFTDHVVFKSKYKAVINNQIAKGWLPTDIFIESIPMDKNDTMASSGRAVFTAFQTAIYEICQEIGCHYIPWYEYMIENYTIANTVWLGSDVHLSNTGHAVKAAFVGNIINNNLDAIL